MTLVGAQAVVAWVLQKASPGAAISMVAEEDSADLRCTPPPPPPSLSSL